MDLTCFSMFYDLVIQVGFAQSSFFQSAFCVAQSSLYIRSNVSPNSLGSVFIFSSDATVSNLVVAQ